MTGGDRGVTASPPDVRPEGRPVVVGVDGSRSAGAAVRVAAAEARARGVGLRLVMVFPRGFGEHVPAAAGVDPRVVLRTAGELVLDTLEAEVVRDFPGVPVGTALVEGPAAEVLVAEGDGAQLLCVGSTSSGGLDDLLLGSTAAAVAAHARCPVLVVPLRPATAVTGRSGVVVGLAGDDGDDELLAFAVQAATNRRSSVIAVHTWQHTVPGLLHLALEPLVDEQTAQRREEALVTDVLDRAGEPPVPVHTVVRRAGAAQTLLAAAFTAELLVVGHRHRVGPIARLRSVTSAVLHRAACPVAVLPLGAGVPAAAPAGG
ncbi:universal stress protein [Trujillonella humicola]|uniref:universal stress protein n=1 Tax=Trujillonella humicola TaxID=3383699 RepID=UPI003906CA70